MTLQMLEKELGIEKERSKNQSDGSTPIIAFEHDTKSAEERLD